MSDEETDSLATDISKLIAESVQLETFDFPEGHKRFMTLGEYREWGRNRIISRNGISAAFSIAALTDRSEEKQRRVREAETLAQEAKKAADRRLAEAEERLQRIYDTAARDDAGRRVYRTEDRTRAFYDDGTELSAQERNRIDWKDGQPTWEERQQAMRARESALEERDRVEKHQERLSDPALSDDELAAMELDLQAIAAPDLSTVRGSAAQSIMGDRSIPGAPLAASAFNSVSATQTPPGPQNAHRPPQNELAP